MRMGDHKRRLQWGRNFIVAETCHPWLDGGHGSRLQWGRNFIVAETYIPIIRADDNIDASMGPQLYRCGNWNVMRMGDHKRRLQWGRNFIVAETCHPWLDGGHGSRLQWGRNFIVAETYMYALRSGKHAV